MSPLGRAASLHGLLLAVLAPISLAPLTEKSPPSFPGVQEHSPAQDLDFCIFTRRMMMASKWEMSPRMRKMFMALGELLWGKGTEVLSAGGESAGRECFTADPRPSGHSPPARLSFFPRVWIPLFWERKVQASLTALCKHFSPARHSSWTSLLLTFPPR